MSTLTAAQLAALTALRTARRASASRHFFTAEELGGVSGSALAALIRKGLVEQDQHHLSDYVYNDAPRYGITGRGLARLGRIERELA